MKKVELLSPVGNMEMLYQAVHNGADAVYLAGKRFGARKYANNFDDEEIIYAIKYCHLYGVKVYVTVNTMIYESELDDVLEYLKFLHINGVDAIIMQDIGLISKVRYYLPNLEIHASTQLHNHNNSGAKLLKELGVTRIVFDREMSISDIKNINIDIEKEVFVYGALCVCYSGCCLFSSLNGGRSGNRGECVGSCRLPYKLIENNKYVKTDGKYLLSTKDLNSLPNLKSILDSGVDCLKIEGRMKSPYYVGYVTRVFRKLIDKYYENEEMVLGNEELTNLKKLFNRGFTTGYISNNNDIMNIKSPNHIGIKIGEVIDVNKDKIYIKLDKDNLNQEDGIRFIGSDKGMIVNRLYNMKNMLVNNISIGNVAVLDNKVGLKNKDIVVKTIDSKLVNDIRNYNEKKISIDFKIEAKVENKFKVCVSDGVNTFNKEFDVIDKARSMPISENDIINSFSKLGNSPFIINNIEIDMDNNIFIPKSILNNYRRIVIDELINIRENSNKDNIIINDIKDNNYNIDKNINNKININVLVRNREQLECCIDNNIDNIYIDNYELYNEYKDKYDNIYYKVNRVYNDSKYKNFKLLLGDIGSIYNLSKDNYVVSDYYLNVSNRYSISLLNRLGAKRITLSCELDDNEIRNVMNNCNSDIELIIYGRLELMIMKYDILNYLSNYNKNNKYYLESITGKKYPIILDKNSHIMHSDIIDKINSINEYKNMGINNFRIELFDEDKNDIEKIINKIKKLFN